ncbi:MAG TPA: XRE family transcriptional regulator [Thiolapillus brandeum]|uniref:XRE family transcriptional regulator n=1 Tax=Thiolapillus brandeum TaxID=1076588 RepID=A0A831RZG3_9GAMM|nr:XRE family transcriptional regulator [Thiolapillus brandeum]
MIDNTISPELQELAGRLRMRRIARGDRQSDMAARIGVSVPTYRRMERGDPATPMGYWVKAMRLLGTVERLADTIPVSLFDEDDLKNRKRVRRRAASR